MVNGKVSNLQFYYTTTQEAKSLPTELYASCLNGVVKNDEAREMFTEALHGIETEISEAEVLRDGIKEKLKEKKQHRGLIQGAADLFFVGLG